MIKRLFDIIFSFVGLLGLFPIFIIIAILIKRDSKGPVFFRGERVGRDGKLFKIYKFRTGEILAGSKDPEKAYMEKIWPEKQRLRLEYARGHSPWIDFKIILKTLKIVVFS